VSRVRPARAPESEDPVQHTVVLSKQQLKIAREAVALARQDRENERRAAAGQSGPGAGPPTPPGSPEPGTREPAAAPQPAEPEAAAEPGSAGPQPAEPEVTGPGIARPAAASPVTGPAGTAARGTGPAGVSPGAAGGGPQAQPAQRPPAEPPGARPVPPWGTVLVTTIRLWAQRHLGRLWPATPRWRLITILLVAAVLFGGGAITVALARGGTSSGSAGPGGAGAGAGGAALTDAAAARSAAATWVARQVSADAIIACDPRMCAALQQHAIPASRLLVLGAANPAPLGTDVIVSTAAVRSELGGRLAGVYAPVDLASFGTGSAQVAIRVVAPDGSAAYLRQLRSDVKGRKSAGQQLLGNPRIQVSGPARRALAAGQVDSRLLSAFAALATMYSVDVTGLGPAGAGAGPGMPVRSAEIAPGRRTIRHRPDTLSALASFLRAQQPPFRPAGVTTVRLPSGRTVLRVSYGAPEPLGLLGKG
jgi:hypothetical protein